MPASTPTLPVYRLLWTLYYTPPANIHLSFPWPRHRHPQEITIGSSQDFLLHHTNQGSNQWHLEVLGESNRYHSKI